MNDRDPEAWTDSPKGIRASACGVATLAFVGALAALADRRNWPLVHSWAVFHSGGILCLGPLVFGGLWYASATRLGQWVLSALLGTTALASAILGGTAITAMAGAAALLFTATAALAYRVVAPRSEE